MRTWGLFVGMVVAETTITGMVFTWSCYCNLGLEFDDVCEIIHVSWGMSAAEMTRVISIG